MPPLNSLVLNLDKFQNHLLLNLYETFHSSHPGATTDGTIEFSLRYFKHYCISSHNLKATDPSYMFYESSLQFFVKYTMVSQYIYWY